MLHGLLIYFAVSTFNRYRNPIKNQFGLCPAYRPTHHEKAPRPLPTPILLDSGDQGYLNMARSLKLRHIVDGVLYLNG
jgi:hypothetical protein